jgi:hypothetical protein
MKHLAALIINDFRNIFRDDILKVLFFVPFVFILMLRFGLPVLLEYAPAVSEYRFLITGALCLVTASFPAYIVSFIMLDEKDEGIFIMYKVLPMSDLKLFIYRVGFQIAFSWVYTLLILMLSDSEDMLLWQKISAALLFSLLPPMITLAAVTFARNKIEGVTIMKLLNFIIFLPVAGFFIDIPWKYLFGIIPFFWSYQIMEVYNNIGMFMLSLGIGIIMHLLVLRLIFAMFIRKIS